MHNYLLRGGLVTLFGLGAGLDGLTVRLLGSGLGLEGLRLGVRRGEVTRRSLSACCSCTDESGIVSAVLSMTISIIAVQAPTGSLNISLLSAILLMASTVLLPSS
jgi:hypothetical protein